MEQGFIDTIQKMVNDYGKDTLLDARKAKSMLADFTQNGFPKETNVLKQLLDAQCAKLINEADNVAEVKAGLAKRLEDEHAISPKFSVEMLDLLGLVLRGDKTKTVAHSEEAAKAEARAATYTTAPAFKSIAYIMADEQTDDAETLYKKGDDAYNRKDYAEAFKNLNKAAEMGHASAMHSLGHCYRYGHGVSIDKAKAEYWSAKAMELVKLDPWP